MGFILQRKNANNLSFDELETQIEPAPTGTEKKEVIEAVGVKIENAPSLLIYVLGGAVLGYIALKI